MNNLIKIKGRYYTKNLVPGKSVYGERLIKKGKNEYREWIANRSKLGAGLMKGINNPIKSNSLVLYLGASTGTTVSHVSDIASDGRVYAVEFAPEPMKHLILLAQERRNIIPLFYDANHPEEYSNWVGRVDIVFQDIAQKNQVEIFINNCVFLKKGGIGMLALKARSVDVTKKPWMIFKEVNKELSKTFKVIKKVRLEPYEKDHMLFVVKKI